MRYSTNSKLKFSSKTNFTKKFHGEKNYQKRHLNFLKKTLKWKFSKMFFYIYGNVHLIHLVFCADVKS